MATTVTVLCPNGRRVNIKVLPTTTLLQILEQACAKQKFDPDTHSLKHHSKMLDLSTIFRYSNLPQNAKLEMVALAKPRTEVNEVVLAVQCEDGSRVQGKFNPSSTSLWGALTNVGVVKEDDGWGGGRFEPVVVYMNNQICGENALKQKTLKDLGLTSGRGVVRLLHRERHQKPTPQGEEMSTESPGDQQEPVGGGEVKTKSEDVATGEVKTESKDVATGEVKMESEDTSAQESHKHSSDNSVDGSGECGMGMESDDEQPKSKLSNNTVDPKQSNIKSSHTSTTPTSTTNIEDQELPYFPAHPISIFPVEEPSAKIVLPPQPMSEFAASLYLPAAFAPTLDPAEPMELPPLPSFQGTSSQSRSRVEKRQPVKVYDEPCDREVVVYHLENSLPMSPSEELPDNFFDVTVQDVQLMYGDLKKQAETAEAPLLTRELRKMLKYVKYDHYEVAVIRIHFPDQWVLQGCFRPREKLKEVVKFIREHLADPQLKFHLYTTPPKNILRSGRMTIMEAGFVPAAIVHLGMDTPTDTPTPLLSHDTIKCAQSALEAEIVMARKREGHRKQSSSSASSLSGSTATPPSGTSHTSSENTNASSHTAAQGGGVSGGGARKVPKWFKPGK